MRAVTILLALLVSVMAHAQGARAGQMARSGIETALIGAAIDGEYADGRAFSESFDKDMTSRYVEEGRTTTGRMRFEGNLICFTYDDTMSGGCFEVWRRSANCFDFYGTGEGIADATLAQRREGTGWTARGWRKDAPSTCVGDKIADVVGPAKRQG